MYAESYTVKNSAVGKALDQKETCKHCGRKLPIRKEMTLQLKTVFETKFKCPIGKKENKGAVYLASRIIHQSA